MKTMFYREERNPGNEETKEVLTDYMNNSMKMDGRYSRESFGYWSSPCEMFARAGACYLNDRLKEYGDAPVTCADIQNPMYSCTASRTEAKKP